VLHWIGLFSGVIFLGSSMLYTSLTTGSARPLAVRHVVVFAMLLLTLISQFGVSTKMASLRTSFHDIDAVAPTDPARLQFESLHKWSVRLEVGILLMGLAAVYVTGRTLT
jgi:hypothetical protein